MQYRNRVDEYFCARERLEAAQFEGLEGLEPRLLMAATAPKVKVKDASVLEGDSGTFNTMRFEVVRRGPALLLDQTTRVNFATNVLSGANAALQGADFIGRTGVIKFKPGQKTKLITVKVVGNDAIEDDKFFGVNLTSVKGGRFAAKKSATGRINDDDAGSPATATPTVSITDVTHNEGNAGTTAFTFTVSLSNAHDVPVTVEFSTKNGTAKAADSDYQTTQGTLTFAPGVTSQNVTVLANGDTKAELDETFLLQLANATNAVIVDAVGVGNILNDDGPPSLRINDVSITEGVNGQTSKAIFTVTLNGQLDEDLTVDYTVGAGSATAGVDFTAATGTITFEAGETSKTIEVDILGDDIIEPDETFFVNLSNLTLSDPDLIVSDVVVLTDGSGRGTIVNDDEAPTLTINNVSKAEGNAGTTNFIFTLTLDSPATETATVDYAINDGTALETDDDFVAATGTVTFNVGETTKTITVVVNGDTKFEANETFFVNLSNPSKLIIGDGQGQGTITNDDTAPKVSISDASATEANATSVPITFTVSLDAPSGLPVTVNFATANNTALSGSDYTASSGTVTFAAGETSKTVTINVLGNTINEPTETFFVNLSGASGATIADGQGVGTINDNDSDINVSISDGSGFSNNAAQDNDDEEDGGQKAWRFTITLSEASDVPITVNFATANGTATVGGNDYVAKSGSVTFQPGELTKQIDVFVKGDTDSEEDEFFYVNLTSASGANIIDSQGVGTIVNDDALPFLIVEDVLLEEGEGGDVTLFNFAVRLSEAQTDRIVKVNYATSDESNSTFPVSTFRSLDYVPSTGTLFFQPGETVKFVTVVVNNDEINEGSEEFTVTLSDAVEATIQKETAAGVIFDDDPVFANLSPELIEVVEGNDGTKTLIFAVLLDRLSERTITVSYRTLNGSATVGDSDYVANSGTVTFGPGSTVQTIAVVVNGDTKVEGDENFFLELTGIGSTGGNVFLGPDTFSEVIIYNDDTNPVLSVNNIVVDEGDTGTTSVTFTISLSAAANQAVTVNYATANGTATAGSDYQGVSGAVTFNPNETSKTVTVQIIGDTTFEANETFFFNLSNATGPATIADPQGQATITNDDPVPPQITVNDPSVIEGTGAGTTTISFTVSLDKVSTQAITVNYNTSVPGGTGSATSGVDFTPQNGTLVFNPGQLAQIVTITVARDADIEGNELLFLNLSNVTGGAEIQDDIGVGTITDDDTP